MSRTKRYVQRKAVERIPAPALNAVGKVILQSVDAAVAQRWDRALRLAAEAEGETVDARVRSISKRFKRELSAMGAATGAVAAAPGLGTTAAASALLADLAWFAMRSTDLIMAIGAAHGQTSSTVEERRAWVLSVLAFGEEAAEQFVALLDEFGSPADGQITAGTALGSERVSARLAGLAGGDAATLDAIRRINASLATTVITKYGSRRSMLAIGKLLPFGIGAVVGGSANYGLIRVVGSQANRFFASYRLLRPTAFQPPPPLPPATVEAMNEDWPPPGSEPPPPAPGSRRLPNPLTRLTRADRRKAIPTTARPADTA